MAFRLLTVTRDADGEPWTRQTTGYECVSSFQDPQAGLRLEIRLHLDKDGIHDLLLIVSKIGTSGRERDGQIARIDTSHGTVHLHWFGPDGDSAERVDTLAQIPLGHPEAVGFFNAHFDQWYNKMEVILRGGRP